MRALLGLPGRAVRAALLGLIWVYRRLVSPLLGPTCRYYPSCSSYAEQAIRIHGAGKGTVLALARLGRCHPWTPGGVDHVPPLGRWRRDPEPHDCPAVSRETVSIRPAVPSIPAQSVPVPERAS